MPIRAGWVIRGAHQQPRPLCVLAERFVETFLPDVENPRPTPPQDELDFGTEHLKWVQVNPGDEASACTFALLEIVETSDPPVAISDLTLIVDSSKVGHQVMDMLQQQKGIRCIDTLDPITGSEFERETEGRRKKLAFFKGDARVKVTTMHSFKGWESKALVVLITNAQSDEALSLAYTGITRLKRSESGAYMTIVCSAQRLASFGSGWRVS